MKKKNKSQLEQEFRQLVETVGVEIETKMEQASKLLREACKLSEEHGIPFYSPVSILGDNYVPRLFKNKFGSLDYNDVADLTGVLAEDLDSYHDGWNHSEDC